MAELPRYRRDNLLGAISPQYQGVALQQAARASSTLAEAMDRVSRAAFAEVEQRAKIEGIEYGAANAPTVEQLAQARASGQDIEAMLPGDQTTVFGSNARAVALELVTTNLEKEARESITALQVGYEAGTVSLAEMQSKLATIEDSYSSIVAEISPAASAKLRAGISLAGNSAFLSAAKDEVAKNKTEQEVSFRAYIDQQISGVQSVVKAGGTMGPDNALITVPEHVETLRQKIISAGRLLGDTDLAQTKLNELEKAYDTAQIVTVMADVDTNPNVGLLALDGKATLSDDAQMILNEMRPDLRSALRKELSSAITSRLSIEQQLESKNERALEKKAEAQIVKIIDAKRANNTEGMIEALDELAVYDADKYASYANAMLSDGGTDDEDTVETLTRMSINFTLTEEVVNAARASGKLKLNSYLSFLEKVGNSRDESYRDAMGFVKRSIGYPDKPIANAGPIDRQAMQEVNEIENALFLERRANPDTDAYSFVKPLIDLAVQNRRDAKTRAKAQAAYRRANNRFKNITDANALLQKYEDMPNAPESVLEGLRLYIELEDSIR